MSNIGRRRVPDEGPDDARIILVGEAPGEDEERQGRPFVGRAGQFLERYLSRCGLERRAVYLSNLCHYRPKGNKFQLLLGSEELDIGLEELGQTIAKIKPNIIIALGNWPMYFLTGATAEKGKPGTGIKSWRGSIIPADYDARIRRADPPSVKVGVTYHPSYVQRPEGFSNHPLFHADLLKFSAASTTPLLNYPTYEELIDPPNIWEIVGEMTKAEWVAVDIETFGDTLACIGFADGAGRGLCITYENDWGWGPARTILEGPARKIFQYGTFDINYLHRYYGINVANYAFDTYIATANLLPEMPKGLDFLCSIYTDFPFYKEERKEWKKNSDLSILWRYNIKDCIATYMIAMKQMRELIDLYAPLKREAA